MNAMTIERQSDKNDNESYDKRMSESYDKMRESVDNRMTINPTTA